MSRYQCPTCKQRYDSPIPLSEPPTCSGNSRKHSPKRMTSQVDSSA